MGTAPAFDQIVGIAKPKLRSDCSVGDAAAVIAALSLVILSDEVVTLDERATLVATLDGRFGIRMDPNVAKQVLECVANVPCSVLLRDIGEHCRSWPRQRICDLFESLWSVAGTDQNLAWGELAILKRLSAHLDWSDDRIAQTTVSRRDAVVLSHIQLEDGAVLRVGRSLNAEICLHRAPIAAAELRLSFAAGVLAFETLVPDFSVTKDGRPAAKGELRPGETICIGRYQLRFQDERDLLVVYPGFQTLLEVKSLVAAVGREGHKRNVLTGVDFQVAAGEMLAVIGPSGCGKSTLLSVLRGDLAAANGAVKIDGIEVHPGAHSVVRRISLVPQEELLLATLTVEETVTYAARLKGIGRSRTLGVMAGLVDEILERAGLGDRDVRESAVGDSVKRGISGGQRRRVSVAQELVGDDTDVLLLDEPTSGLDPRSESGILALMRDLADGGRVVVAATHAIHPDALGMFDRVLCLDARGRVEYLGDPAGLFTRFGTNSTAEIFERLEESAGVVASGPQMAAPAEGPALASPPEAAPAVPRLGLLSQMLVLVRREIRMRARDRASLVLAMGLPIAVSGLCSLVYKRDCVQATLLFVLCLTSVWTGVSFTVRDLIANFAVLRHESRTRASLGAAYGAKALIATAASAVQAALLVAAIFSLFGAHNASSYSTWPSTILEHTSLVRPFPAFIVLWTCHCFGNALGMLLSASFRTATAAIFMIPFAILPMVTFSGTLVPPRDLPPPWGSLVQITPLYQGYIGLLGTTLNVCSSAPVNVDEPAITDRSSFCSLRYRTVPPPQSDPGAAPFVQTAASCEHNLYQRTVEFCHGMELCPPDPEDPSVGRLQIGRNVGVLVLLTSVLHVLAIGGVRRRMRTI